jgi:hypothetical protein
MAGGPSKPAQSLEQRLQANRAPRQEAHNEEEQRVKHEPLEPGGELLRAWVCMCVRVAGAAWRSHAACMRVHARMDPVHDACAPIVCMHGVMHVGERTQKGACLHAFCMRD